MKQSLPDRANKSTIQKSMITSIPKI